MKTGVFVSSEKTQYFLNGKLHREDGPAIEFSNGTKKWYLNDKLHRVDGPAIEWSNGTKAWWFNGKLHREDGPAYEGSNGHNAWWFNGQRHRVDGPAVEDSDGRKEWWIEGIQLTQDKFERYQRMKEKRYLKAIKTVKKYLLPIILSPNHKIGARIIEDEWKSL